MKMGSMFLMACLCILFPAGSIQVSQNESTQPTLVWMANNTYYPFSEFSPMAHEGVVCASNNKGLRLITIVTGEEIWNKKLLTSMVPLIDCGHIFYVNKMLWGGFSQLNCHSTTTDSLLWTQRVRGRPTFLPVIVEEKMILTSGAYSEIVGRDPVNENWILCLNKYTGAQIWGYEGQGKMNSSPSVVDHTVYASSSEGILYAVDLESGDLKWMYTARPSPFMSKTPCVYGEKVYHVGEELHCLNLVGEFLWNVPVQCDQKVWASSHRLYTMADDHVISMDADTGDILWKYPIDNYFFATAVGGWEHIFFGDDRTVYCLSREGKLLWKYPIQDHDDFFIHSTPLLYEGYLIMGTSLGHVYTFQLPGEWCYQEAEAMYEDGDLERARGWYTRALHYYQQKGDVQISGHITGRLTELGTESAECAAWAEYEDSDDTLKSFITYGFLGAAIFMGVLMIRNLLKDKNS